MSEGAEGVDVPTIMAALYGDGIVSRQAAFDRGFIASLDEQIAALFEEARATKGGAMPRGPNRYYVELQPERLDGFVEIVSHPWFVAVVTAVLGRDYKIVEFGFDIPLPGAQDQPWHRDFPADSRNATGYRLSSLAFNLTTVDTRQDHGPFEIAPGTQWDDIGQAKAGMFPVAENWDRYREQAVQKLPQRGDISARSGLTIHRGTANRSDEPRPVLIVGVVAADVADADVHMLEVTAGYLKQVPQAVREHLFCRVVDHAGPIRQRHMIEGLLAAGYG